MDVFTTGTETLAILTSQEEVSKFKELAKDDAIIKDFAITYDNINVDYPNHYFIEVSVRNDQSLFFLLQLQQRVSYIINVMMKRS